MKRLLCLLAAAALASAGVAKAADPELKTESDKTIYALGLVISENVAAFHLTPAEVEIVKAGLSDGLLKNPPKVELDTYGPKIRDLAQQRATAMAAENKQKGKAFLDKIASNPKVQKKADGLLMETVSEGTGPSPVPTDTVKVNYRVTLIDGTEIDSSAKKNAPATFRLDQVIKCWTQALEFMKAGGKAKLYCPSDIAYGDQGRPGIPPGATLVFDLELLEIEKPAVPAAK
jgi:FKBP-type peptidyl-prolyl cis-trans isomerase FkpA